MKTDKTRVTCNRRIQSLILAGLTALSLTAPALRAQTPPPPAETAPSPAQDRVDKRADLSIQRVDLLFYSGGSYDKTRAFVFVQNQGLSNAKACTLTLQSWSPATGTVQLSVSVPALKPGAVVGVTVNTPIGVGEPGTSHHFAADAFNAVNERDEFNNTYDFNNL